MPWVRSVREDRYIRFEWIRSNINASGRLRRGPRSLAVDEFADRVVSSRIASVWKLLDRLDMRGPEVDCVTDVR